MRLIGLEFDLAHGGGTTRYQVRRRHRDAGYFECVATKAIGTHQFVGSLQVFGQVEIEARLTDPSCSCGTKTGIHDAACFLLPDGVRAEWEAEDFSLESNG